MGLDERAELEHDLRVTAEWDQSRITGPPAAVDECDDDASGAGPDRPQPAHRQRLAPQLEQLPDGGHGPARIDFEDARSIDCPQRVNAAASRDDGAISMARRGDPDPGRHREPAVLAEQLDMRAIGPARLWSAAQRADRSPGRDCPVTDGRRAE